MFTWIYPQCGREVPPAYNECPDCANKTAPGESAPPPQAAGPSPTSAPPPFSSSPGHMAPAQSAPPYPPQQAYPPPPTYPPPPVQAPPEFSSQSRPAPAASFLGLSGGPSATLAPQASVDYPPQSPAAVRHGLPTWLMTIVFTLAFFGLTAGVFLIVGYMKSSGAPAPSATVESPAAKPGAQTSPIQKYIEISGVRFMEDAKKQPTVTFVIINHSTAEIGDVAGNVTVWGRTRKSEEEAAGSFTFKTSLEPNQSRELSAPLNTKLKFYELPDWQNVSTDIQITAPATSPGSPALP